jgi:dynein heavy chain
MCAPVGVLLVPQGCANPVNDYLKMTNKKKVTIRDINPKSISTQVGASTPKLHNS